jgi:hypothetical protein
MIRISLPMITAGAVVLTTKNLLRKRKPKTPPALRTRSLGKSARPW